MNYEQAIDRGAVITAQIKELESELRTCRDIILATGQSGRVKGALYSATILYVTRRTLDSKGIKESYPDLWEAFSRETTTTSVRFGV